MKLALLLAAMVPAFAGCAFNLPLQPSLDGSRWQVAAINGEAVPGTSAYQVEFSGARFGGRLGCNSFSGSYLQGSEMITVGPVAATQMACAGPAMSHESAGFALLAQPLRMIWTDLGRRLILKSPAGTLDLRRLN